MGPFIRVTNAPFGLYVPIYSTLEQVMIKSCYIEVDNQGPWTFSICRLRDQITRRLLSINMRIMSIEKTIHRGTSVTELAYV
jgi:hypothetical protein